MHDKMAFTYCYKSDKIMDLKNVDKLREKISAEVYMMVNHDDDIELAEEVINDIMKHILEYKDE